MAREHLEDRDEWQREAGARGRGAEDIFHIIITLYLRDTEFEVTERPDSLQGIYGRHDGTGRPHGIIPESVIRNTKNGKMIWVEIKRQRAAGNAHERACKYFMPGIVESARNIGRHPEGVIPFWLIFTNGIARSPCYRQEILHWFRGYEKNLLLWKSLNDHGAILEHFERHIKPLLS